MPEQPVPPRLHKAYIASAAWQTKRWERFILDRFACQGCGAEDWPLDCHHLTYERLGQEEMDDLVTLCRNCHDLVEKLDWSIEQLKEYLEGHAPEPEPELPSGSFILGLMLKKPVDLYQQSNRWLAELEEERITLEDFVLEPGADYLLEIAAFGHPVTDEVRVVHDRLTERVSGVDLENPKVVDALRTDVVRLRMRSIEWDLDFNAYEQDDLSKKGVKDEDLVEFAQAAQALITRKRKLDSVLHE